MKSSSEIVDGRPALRRSYPSLPRSRDRMRSGRGETRLRQAYVAAKLNGVCPNLVLGRAEACEGGRSGDGRICEPGLMPIGVACWLSAICHRLAAPPIYQI